MCSQPQDKEGEGSVRGNAQRLLSRQNKKVHYLLSFIVSRRLDKDPSDFK